MGSKRPREVDTAPAVEDLTLDGPPEKKPRELERHLRESSQRSMPHSFGIRVSSAASGNAPGAEGAATKLGESPIMLKTYCQHDVSLPAGYPEPYDFDKMAQPADHKPAKEYAFTLDAFQRESVKCIERNESVLVAAHTSAGKTVVAEYAIATALREKQRVIYTSPIKALSNQKFRELEHEFSDVGLMTGDVTINKNASCLVMTTEILRSMLYRGSEVVREVSWVIFDEVHYMRDQERGVVWEETIILVPQNVRFVFLSATIPNAREFSEWIAHLKNQPCHTIYTDTRPVPLQHYLFPSGGEALHLIVDDKGNFKMDAFEKAMTEMGSNKNDKLGSGGGGALVKKKKNRRDSGVPGKSDCFKVVKMIMDRDYHPVIVFSFSRRDCEAMAMQMAQLECNNEEEQELVSKVFENAVSSLNVEDQSLPQITAILPLLKKGVGIHHSGLLPIIKEVVEILFQEGLLKCLFATETFSMGLNMPARTVVFSQYRKFDGSQFRPILGGEYVQMSGRAGRRGIDAKGIAILMCDEKIEPTMAKNIMSGSAEPLKSTFRLGYNMLLNLLRAEEADPEYVIARSLAQFQADRALPANEKKLQELEMEKASMVVGGQGFGVEEHEVKTYFKLREVVEKLRKEIRDLIHKPSHIVPFLQPGRLTRVRDEKLDIDYGWGAIIQFTRKGSASRKKPEDERYSIDVLLRCEAGSNKGKRPRPYKLPAKSKSENGSISKDKRKANAPPKEEWIVVNSTFRDLDGLSALRVYKPADLRSEASRAAVGASVVEVLRRFPDGPPMLDPFGDLGISDEGLPVLLRKAEAVEEALIASPVAKCPRLEVVMSQWRKKQGINDKVKAVKRELEIARGIILKEELKRMKRVLRRLNFTDNDSIVQVKGRVACEVNSADELVITELLLGGNLNHMAPEVLVSLCSCFILDEGKKDENLKLEKDLETAYQTVKTVATRVATVTKESNILIDIETYVESFSPNAMNVVYFWCKGQSFSEVCKLSDLFEGSVVRCFRRLEELLRQLVAAVKGIGNTELEQKFEAGSAALKRGIAFHASLYT
ncbi:superkiller viralicidic activity 2-like 2, putative [Chondrus crispus]|uniref:Superkiller viralicidic activity 2-like 2, putative n=1 Tax=Chondrus crispus TaxID=2769 RepID=R7Q2Z4_CHOCR|nr:superkiller viralicidic activity 2-like 2, putative [Chondrus crispus]CDF32268.1 superkiller viralicidic activity 2-like 2, putative [Chondrus crispus]|eukprot:XP_005711933.1 superkiller viralicidic activity 2-like 2, putative [Chondrus crispus]